MSEQLAFFRRGGYGETHVIQPRDRHMQKAERPRLSAQCADILARLREGPATNAELAALALKYTSRLSDLRAAGYVIEVVERDHVTGRVVYELKE